MEPFYFKENSELNKRLALAIADDLKRAIAKNGIAYLLVSGGSTPKCMYTKLSHLCLPWEKVHIGLVDERFVALDAANSNELMIRKYLLVHNASAAHFYGMIETLDNEEKNVALINEKYQFFRKITVTILGMGSDGHTASLFPGDPVSIESFKEKKHEVISTKAPKAPISRITCNKEMLLSSNKIYLMTTGDEKYNILNYKDNKNLPIFNFTNSKKVIRWYHSFNLESYE